MNRRRAMGHEGWSLGDELARAAHFEEAVGAVVQAGMRLGLAHCDVVLQPVVIEGDDQVGLRVLGPRGWFATLVCKAGRPIALAVERELAVIATYLSVWCTEHGLGYAPPDGVRLTPRQYEIALRAGRGETNPEIAQALAISINTVKVRLKQVFERLHVANRTELANVLRTWAADPSTNALSPPRRRA